MAQRIYQQLTADARPVHGDRPTVGAAPEVAEHAGIVDARGEKHRLAMANDLAANRADTQATKMRAPKTMANTSRHRGRG
jgi:hypothetical protein